MPHELALTTRTLTVVEFAQLAHVPPELEWCATIQNPQTRHASHHDITDLCHFVGIPEPEGLRTVTHVHVLAWRAHEPSRATEALCSVVQGASGSNTHSHPQRARSELHFSVAHPPLRPAPLPVATYPW
jgi:hypothetical protein